MTDGPTAVPAAPSTRSLPLWPDRPRPALRLVFPKTARATPTPALVVFRGGGYSTPFGSGGDAPEWAASHGFVGIAAEYRTRATSDAYPAGYDDAARAVRLVRSRAREWGVDPTRVVVIGFSAGGHLASLLSTQPLLRAAPEDDLAPHVSARADAIVLAYPVVSFVEGYAPGAFWGTAESFFGRSDLSESLRREFSNELHVEPTHPPVFVWTTRDDEIVPHTHAQLFAEACARAGVPVTFKLFRHGRHGLGLATGVPEVEEWTTMLLAWLDAHVVAKGAHR